MKCNNYEEDFNSNDNNNDSDNINDNDNNNNDNDYNSDNINGIVWSETTASALEDYLDATREPESNWMQLNSTQRLKLD